MKNRSQLLTLAVIAAAAVIFGMVLAGGLSLTRPGRAAEGQGAVDRPLHAAARDQQAAPRSAPSLIPASFADIVARVNPAVVGITAVETVRPQRRPRGQRPSPSDPFEYFFGPGQPHPFIRPEEEGPRNEQSGGSGFLVSDDGLILTNYHVIEGATKIRVHLTGDPRDYLAEVVGSDPNTDVALIRVKIDKRLPHLELGNSDAIRVGDWVLALGNPLSYDHTLTVGVVSGKGRQLGAAADRDFSLDDFIQTDAAINFGNSGGPLLDLEGRVVGVNTAISIVGQGIGFAVPINIARDVMEQIRTKGKVARGYLGLRLGDISADLQEAWGLKAGGSLVQMVVPGLPADAAGVKHGDVITAVDGKPVADTGEVVRLVSAREPGASVRLTILRGGKEITVSAKLGERPVIGGSEEGREAGGEPGAEPNERMLGISVDELTPEIGRRLNLEEGVKGVLVREVSQVSQAYERGIRRGDVITEVNRVAIASLADYRREIRKVKQGGLVVFYVVSPTRGPGDEAIARFVTIRLEPIE